MPHKVNPIWFENAEGNLGLSNALLAHLADALPVARWQRDLRDSTRLRNIGSALGYALVAYRNLEKGLERCQSSPQKMLQELQHHPEILGEAVQTLLRKHGVVDAYEQLKRLTRGSTLAIEEWHAWLNTFRCRRRKTTAACAQT